MLDDHLDPLTVTVEKAAALLGVSRSTGYDLTATGEIPTIRVRCRILVPAKALADVLGLSVWKVRSAVTTVRTRPSAAARSHGRRQERPDDRQRSNSLVDGELTPAPDEVCREVVDVPAGRDLVQPEQQQPSLFDGQVVDRRAPR